MTDEPTQATPQTPSPMEKVENILKKIEETNQALDEKIKRLNEIEANRLLSGTGGGHIEAVKTDPCKKMSDEIVKAFR